MPRMTRSEKSEDKKQDVEQPQTEPNGILFWHGARADGADMAPVFYPDPSLAPKHAVVGSSEYPRIEHPIGSGNHLKINGMERIMDRKVAIYLIMNSKSAVAGSQAGSIFYDPADVVKSGLLSKAELEKAEAGINPDGADSKPLEPIPEFAMMPVEQLHQYARDVCGFELDTGLSKMQKESALIEWHRAKRQKV